MAGKVCPLLSSKQMLENCIGSSCMMFLESAAGGLCAYTKGPQQLASKLDTISAQIQELQVALIKLTGA